MAGNVPRFWFGQLASFLAVAGLVGSAYASRRYWLDYLLPKTPAANTSAAHEEHHATDSVRLSDSARINLGITTKPARLQTYWRSLLIPGAIIDRPGISDRGVVATVIGVVTKVMIRPGGAVRPGTPMFELRLASEYVQNAQTELFKATREVALGASQKKLLQEAGDAIAGSRILEIENQIKRAETMVTAYRQDLLTRGFSAEQIASAAEGKFVSLVTIMAPPTHDADTLFEVQEIRVQLGEQVQAGQTMCLLADHRKLLVEGRAFRHDAPSITRATESKWPIRMAIADDDTKWPTREMSRPIAYLANSMDPVSRTFGFYVPLDNDYRSYRGDEETYLIWRYRPGQRVRLWVPVEKLDDVFVLPASGLAREGGEAYVFRENGSLFQRVEVTVRYADDTDVVLANDGKVTPSIRLAQNGASALARILKARAEEGGGGHDHHHDHNH